MPEVSTSKLVDCVCTMWHRSPWYCRNLA